MSIGRNLGWEVLRGILDEAQDGTYLLAAYLLDKGLVLMGVELTGKGCEIPEPHNY